MLGDGVERGRPFGGFLGVAVRELVELARKLAYGVGHGRRLPDRRRVERSRVWQDRAMGWVQPDVDCKSLIDDRSKT
ncbi:hypothetical protein GCM10011583_30620 [Streptomyces camponoticapitis]|uniref:Transposase n=1 Tax=Streptomyces camponoticapitis TaxID=1616125 RepID=A0ABQ2E5P1_9ACTN|nr:hypothetical protein GCM10011583_30620 [Streptomyces camponoticapitis]